MAAMSRTTKAGSDWNDADIGLLKIQAKLQDITEFFGGKPGPIDHLDPQLFSALSDTISPDASKEIIRFLANMEMAHFGNFNQGGALHEFTAKILEVMGYDEYPITLRRSFKISFLDCGKNSVSTTDIALYHYNTGMILLVVRVCTRTVGLRFKAQVIADAIAAFEHNNERRGHLGFPPLDEMVIPCIGMSGSKPFFFKVPVTQQLSDAVSFGTTPDKPTLVTFCSPPSQSQPQGPLEYMNDIAYRRVALQYFEAFRLFMKACQSQMLPAL